MAKLTSLEDLGRLLSESEKSMLEERARSIEPRNGYDGRAQKLGVRLDSKRRRGKTMTIISGFQSTPDELEEIAARIKRTCGAGGTVLDNEIAIQGDHRGTIIAMLKKLGYQVT